MNVNLIRDYSVSAECTLLFLDMGMIIIYNIYWQVIQQYNEYVSLYPIWAMSTPFEGSTIYCSFTGGD